MLEERSPDSCLSSRVFSTSRISESSWSNSFMFPEHDDDGGDKLSNGKRALEVASEIRPTKSLKLMGVSIQYDSDSSDYSGTSQESDSNNNGGDSTDSHSLFNQIGRDNSIDCLIRCSRSDYGSIASLSRNFRSLVKSGEIYRLRRQNGFVEHWVYFSCQPLEWVAFDPVERRWMQLPTMPSSVTFMGADKESLAVGTDLLVLGQAGFSSYVIYRYSLLTNSWSSGMEMNSPRCLFGSASLGEIAIFAGGFDSQRKILDSAEMYNSELQTWTTLPMMNKPRKMCSGVFMDGKFYVIGGIGGPDSKLLTCGEEYDLDTKKWTHIPDLSPPRSRADVSSANDAPPLVAVVNNQLYAADHADMEVRKYDKEKKRWLTVGRLPERAGSVNGWGLAFRACGERLIVIGGPRNSGGGFIELNSWIPSDGGPPQWTLLDRKHSPNFVYNCAVMGC
ncbi:PREDICTED: F-box/kelch-repeat protein SKIP11-like [Brassica oleracea var. oleracea]|uniref:F-box domain-containing protein n=1 Tax=Brassica oleracea var. oleracea TaxID=109376 RepID=A0A0D3AVL1_BRAOL|nr:PREDICTED: F-box/kelch-repeat protein SKIP11-like [Brassica oleracea var. oleracea]XP_013621250.1 PREDICTED: F-box/kelch-repeat protein SKIP11-like [Brassica oleracea var. oleracea]XP_013621251.1 PREDICTED: F-box/kelch-repeat protein SKIP11-like [Brassica oleracea var. oleracea]XP_013621252.1 PREDICTED: F-box/kelch-repeat protein SKIP11-like [Brassica oleracea var. oleracea]